MTVYIRMCPRCGQPPNIYWDAGDNSPSGCWVVECLDCTRETASNKQLAITQWNVQPVVDSLLTQIEQLVRELTEYKGEI